MLIFPALYVCRLCERQSLFVMFIVVYGCAGLLAGELGKKTTCDGTKAIRLLEPSEAILWYGKGWNLSGHIQAGKEA